MSSGECTTSLDQQFVEDFGGFEPSESFSGPAVEFVSDGVEFGLGLAGQVGSFREVLAQQTVGVIVAAALPR
jgi:hypothetical protein